jgi:hypothetical protein
LNLLGFHSHEYINKMHGSRSKIPSKNLVRQRCLEGFNSGVVGLISVGSYRLLCMLTIFVFTVSSCVWVRSCVEILKGPRFPCYVVVLSWCGHQFRECTFRWSVLCNNVRWKNIKKHFTCREIHLIGCIWAFIGRIFLQLRNSQPLQTSPANHMFVCDRSIIKAP